ncbi:glycoside hydrolase [Sphingobacterium sp. CZ-UAM]|uniref:glycoside hydrolase family 43 protein n=1 Tax=Sphingobacterium sp. CZ-UAM TaxID=1933868 RepID=UPI000985B92D|nr:glycoside hydrolase 43 family protein [Sphingobacterium sp. CZ-UAM]OOG19239.1 glycoside hydrolase [Sphingobacterium sp. CZ-UAM]
MKSLGKLILFLIVISYKGTSAQDAQNPIIFADVPDMSMIRVGDTYYMSSTTMHMSPGGPIMKSQDLVNWTLVNYGYDLLGDQDELNLANQKNAYGHGSWASSLRFHEGSYYLSTFSSNTGKTHIYTTKDIENGPWRAHEFHPMLHDHSLFFDHGKIYIIWGSGRLHMAELKTDLSGIRAGTERILIEDATLPSLPKGTKMGLPAEGSQLFKINGMYYLFNISWPAGGMRTVIVHRARQLEGPYEGKVVLQDQGVAQGGLIDMPNGQWYAYLFQDHGAVGRIPFLVPVSWKDAWPVLGEQGKVPSKLKLPESKGLMPGIVSSDEFSRTKDQSALPLVWQWNHQPDSNLWSVTERSGFLRLKTGELTNDFLQAKNTLTQRTIGPTCSGSIAIDVSQMKDGDFAGLSLLQKNYGLLGVRMEGKDKSLVMVNAHTGIPEEVAKIALKEQRIFLKASCDFRNRKDIAQFYYSTDGSQWKAIGNELKMSYTIPHFMGYRFGLFNYASKAAGGYVDFDYFHFTTN